MLGICVGHPAMFGHGVEHGHDAAGVGVLPGSVERLHSERLPHMGWNTVEPPTDTQLFAGLAGQRFYFVHSFGVRTADRLADGARVTWAEHGGDRFIAGVELGALSTTQFHPEKSGPAGAALLRNWIATLR